MVNRQTQNLNKYACALKFLQKGKLAGKGPFKIKILLTVMLKKSSNIQKGVLNCFKLSPAGNVYFLQHYVSRRDFIDHIYR